MIEKNIEVLRKILYAVETGGQAYGKQRYDAFIGAGANTPNEKAITIGAGQWYAGEAKRLLQEIQRADPARFKHLLIHRISMAICCIKTGPGMQFLQPLPKQSVLLRSSPRLLGLSPRTNLWILRLRSMRRALPKPTGICRTQPLMECINIIHQGGAATTEKDSG